MLLVEIALFCRLLLYLVGLLRFGTLFVFPFGCSWYLSLTLCSFCVGFLIAVTVGFVA